MKKGMWICGILLLVGLFLTPHTAMSMGMVTGSRNGTYFQFGKEIAEEAKKAGLDIVVKESRGSLDNILRLDSSENAAFAIVQSDVFGFLKRSSHKTEIKKTLDNLSVIFPFYNEEVHLFAKKEIKRFEDLEGKRIAIGIEGSGNFITSTNLLKIMNIKAGREYTNMKPAEAVEAIFLDKIDAMFYVAGKPVKLFNNLKELKKEPQYAPLLDNVHFVPLNHPDMLKGGEYVASEITYSWIKEKIPTIAVKAILVGYDFSKKRTPYYRMRCKQLAELVKIIRHDYEYLRSEGHPKWKEVNLNEEINVWKLDPCSRDCQHSPSTSVSPIPDKRRKNYINGLRRTIRGE
ncbi:C4-dicarboxylate ABC transporter substrate-bindi ng protein [Desulfonema ishimotonii]|uniref:C4-dicarboxylate ABC transporter substrate-bindi ng protein n=1 Tax=Desulfonema ishimotonii TaxID=45657 RepID=A0A401G1F9_9BACT|nr:TAXI family TRAP transporter solute-binding subunit [Desulfonema ishimotonii]GBC63059.1 C4-dicarboxylate ABC transporter substrate-bindi ng protein [Desulfonema ishimotonii]